jgi:hypothetical protein
MTYEEVAEAVKELNSAEWWRLRDLLDVLIEAPPAPPSESQVTKEMVRDGLIDSAPSLKDPIPFTDWTPIQINGKPLSETIIEERGR